MLQPTSKWVYLFADVSVKEYLSRACEFIDSHIENKEPVLVFSDLGLSRSAMLCIAYLIHHRKLPVQVNNRTPY